MRPAVEPVGVSVLESGMSRKHAMFVEEMLTPSEREIALLIAADILTVEQVAERLDKKPKTVTNQFNSIYRKMRRQFGPVEVGTRREMLRQVMQVYLATRE